MIKSKTYIIAWDGAIDNCLDISKQLTYGKIPHKFFNVSSSPELDENWERKPDVRYYRHFFTALEEFLQTDAKVFIFSAGDGQYFDWANYTKFIEQIFEDNPNLLAFAPNATNDDWSGLRSKIRDSVKYTNFYLTTCTNGIYFAISREMCQVLYDFYKWACIDNDILQIKKMSSGWGIDLIISIYAIYNNKYCYRDKSVKLNHPESSNYDKFAASQESGALINTFCYYLVTIFDYDKNKLTEIITKIGNLFLNPKSLKLEDFYSNPSEIQNA